MVLIAALLIASAPPAPAPSSPSGEWYGWQTLLADAGAVGLGFAYSGLNRTESIEGRALLTLTLGLGELGGPAIHLLHGRPAVAAKDLVLRVAVPGGCALAGLLVGSLITGSVEQGANGAGAGFLVGAGSVMLIDAVFLSREPPKPADGGVRIAPSVQISRDRASASLAIAF